MPSLLDSQCAGIDIEQEKPIPLKYAGALPGLRNPHTNQPTNPSTVLRYITIGARAADGTRVKLEAVRLPSGWCTTAEAAARFIDRLTNPQNETPRPTPKRRQREIESAQAELAALGMT